MTNNPFESIVDFYDESVKKADANGLTEVFKKATEMVFDSLKKEATRFAKLDLTIIDVKYLNGYYIFGTGTNSVVHFYIKETPGWKYGIWWTPVEEKGSTKDNPVYATNKVHCQIFTQYEEEIDKFKPYGSMVQDTFNIYLDDPHNHNISSVWNFVRDIKFIHDEPYLAFYREMHWSDFNREYISRAKAKSYFERHFKQKKLETEINELNDRALLKTIYTILKEDIDEGNCFIEDRGDCWSPRYEIIMKNPFEVEDGCYGIFDCFDEPDATEAKKLFDKTIEDCKKRAKKTGSIWFSCCHDSLELQSEDKFNERYAKANKVDVKTLGE